MNPKNQPSLFPVKNTLAEVYEEARAQLPIKDENKLASILQMHENTLIALLPTQPKPKGSEDVTSHPV